jgi:hypothetical protein
MWHTVKNNPGSCVRAKREIHAGAHLQLVGLWASTVCGCTVAKLTQVKGLARAGQKRHCSLRVPRKWRVVRLPNVPYVSLLI